MCEQQSADCFLTVMTTF